jgi:hypothetical protein
MSVRLVANFLCREKRLKNSDNEVAYLDGFCSFDTLCPLIFIFIFSLLLGWQFPQTKEHNYYTNYDHNYHTNNSSNDCSGAFAL